LSPTKRACALLLAALGAAALGGCGDEAPQQGQPPPSTAQPPPNQPGPKPSAAPTVSPTAGMPPLPLKEFQEADFAETDRSRDPFRTFEKNFVRDSKLPQLLQREVLIDRYALDELKLVGIVTRGPARALLIDPTGLGWVAKVGDFVGKAELVHSGGPTGTDVAINWRIDRIRENDLVFIREDLGHPEIPPTTRVIALRPVEAAGPGGRPVR
jgi:type IV pilus assembly protein PilP